MSRFVARASHGRWAILGAIVLLAVAWPAASSGQASAETPPSPSASADADGEEVIATDSPVTDAKATDAEVAQPAPPKPKQRTGAKTETRTPKPQPNNTPATRPTRQPVETPVAPVEQQKTPAAAGEEPVRKPAPQQTPVADAPADAPAYEAGADDEDELEIAPAQFKGVQPGLSTGKDVIEALGEAAETNEDGDTVQWIFKIEPFDHIAVTLEEDVVRSVVVSLERPFPSKDLADELGLSEIVTVEVRDDAGVPLGLAFPERGVLFSFSGPDGNVAQIILDPISPESFILRAEELQYQTIAGALKDLDHALERAPGAARAYWLRAEIQSEIGQLDDASAAIEQALKLEPESPSFQLTKAKLLALTGQVDLAIAQTNHIVEATAGQPLVQAKARIQLANLLANKTPPDYQAASQQHLDAIKLVQGMTSDGSAAVRRAARRVLLDAHLGQSADIAFGRWKRKNQVVPQWIARADLIATDLEKQDPSDRWPTLRTARAALFAYSAVPVKREEVDRQVDRLNRLAVDVMPTIIDSMTRRQFEWSLGLGLCDAMQIAQAGGQHDRALDYGSQAVLYMERSLGMRNQQPETQLAMGRLYFRMGLVYAVQYENHAAAVEWFQKSVPLLERPLPQVARAEQARLGDMFVSMGVSFWEQGNREEAVRLSTHGAEMLEQAVENHLAETDVLGVPYANLASMHRELGQSQQADNFEQMAEKSSHAKRR